MSAPSLLDHEALEQLRMLEQRRPGMLRTVAVRFVKESEEKTAAIERALLAKDSESTRDLAHSLKGDARLLGAESAAEVCERLEYAARDAELGRCVELLPELSFVLGRTRAALLELPECVGVA
jgi:HPt (histidine-containing phosphotransfer) domain-containing protein